MSALELLYPLGYEQVVFCQDTACGYRAILALHSTALGPATGGTRLWPYASTAEALADALRLSRGMTYKNAAAGLALGGGKAVILAPSVPFDREALFLAHGRAVDEGKSPESDELFRGERKIRFEFRADVSHPTGAVARR